MTFTKLFNTILDSTVWQEGLETRVVWITLLAMADKFGEVQASVPGLARRAGVSLEECKAALAKFLGPDEYSRSRDHDGRRIEEIEGGWRLLNHAYYRGLESLSERREYQRRWASERRARLKARQMDERASKRRGGGPSAAERLAGDGQDEHVVARLEEMQSGVPPGYGGSYGAEAQEVVRGNQGLETEPSPERMGSSEEGDLEEVSSAELADRNGEAPVEEFDPDEED